MTSNEIQIVGASARAAAFSALRAGLTPIACDLFGDEDLRAAARFVPLDGPYPSGFEAALADLEPAPLIYTGGLENHPEVIERLAARRPLWGNGGGALRGARDPFQFFAALATTGASPPEVRPASSPPRDLTGWLRKPFRGAGGKGIATAREPRRDAPGTWYYQRRAPGECHSSLHLARRDGCDVLGVTRQIVGERWLHAPPFAWCGNIGPAVLPGRVLDVIRDAGCAAARAFSLRGLFGIDFLLEGGAVHPVDLNPRYPASTEILEHALELSAILLHRRAFEEGDTSRTPDAPGTPAAGRVLGKAVVYAPRDVVLADDLVALHPPDPSAFPVLADLPRRGGRIAAGRPLLTVFARGEDDASCEAALRRSAREVLGHFKPAPRRSYYRPGCDRTCKG
ncbi:MAG TPA: ATP-grasp domain-containing protein [Planctomycetota bacterium]|nr:ATP-grasp domain-containing protein [Planctomycetota bacterium]